MDEIQNGGVYVRLVLQRKQTAFETTLGQLFVDGSYECRTLEDAIRDHKIHGITAIPAGVYKVSLESSPRFGPGTITINGVPDFTGVRIHGGNTAADTEGCVIVGDRVDSDTSISGGTLRGVLKRLKAKIQAALQDGQECWIEIRNPVPAGQALP